MKIFLIILVVIYALIIAYYSLMLITDLRRKRDPEKHFVSLLGQLIGGGIILWILLKFYA